MRKKRVIFLIPIFAFLWLSWGCGSLNKKFPDKNLFGLGDRLIDVSGISCDLSRSIQIKELTISPAWDAVSFIYKIGENQYKYDYYNEFILPPAVLLTDKLTEALLNGDCFTADQHPAKTLSKLQLEGKIISLYGDYQDKVHPAAVLEIRLTLFNYGGDIPMKLLNRTYSSRQPMESLNPVALSGAWNRSLTKILQEFLEDIRLISF